MEDQEYTFSEVVDRAVDVFKEQEIPEPDRNARLLMQHLFKFENADLVSKMQETMPRDQIAQYSALVTRRLKREPLQYITKRAEFWSIQIYVDQRVLIPRPETEHIIEEVLKDFPEREKTFAIADIGTGSGCLSVALASEFRKAKVFATDIDAGALEIAAINASRSGVTNRTTFLRGDLLAPVNELSSPRGFHIIVSNPPYIAEGEVKSLMPEVSKMEPSRALVPGPSGYEAYERMLPQLVPTLRKGGRFYLEIGMGQEKRVKDLIADVDTLVWDRTAPDLQGIPRVIVGHKES